MRTEILNQKTIGQIVADDYRAAAIFKQAGIDFCCGGNKSIEVACNEKDVDVQKLTLELNELELSTPALHHDFKNWDLGFLADYIVNTHHKYVLRTLPELVHYTQKIAQVHGENHPELIKVASLFFEINRELLQHLKQEEEVLFPAIKEVMKNNTPGAKTTIAIEISRMNGEHEFAGGAMDKINVITNGYSIPADACNTYRVAFKLLEEFEDDLHTHVHLENNILFPKALILAKK
ncbi:MAG: iron-sulfur cluster repair di-iron protein [Bacteroidetes bacterium GWF2_42_66]|nr:MAG: iron-sulfur cluster repair di-iron protein [Bacteroidetes bacterium GWA2_42_15]OFY02459.1 MAG: iron-sulfur cluster repair di-iron protein [Bacteroidetes bacterium GWE2_42_39]OFY41442.1 MAG: iron-sulfur cluster repair di-iron protein [Bacteroidetes bacterium GWF2_42_66]HBL75349.1 iron-sulfur cluster repair di-iron protein [Prolixibacteraceae bacterium]HCR91505.1 iron-sulfur cluster repair di-iron protein [Prolixibacteraceae bacterium]